MTDQEEPSVTDLIPVMRLHLFEGLQVLDRAITKSSAEDIANSIREGLPKTRVSGYTAHLNKVYNSLLQYIGEDENDDRGYNESPFGPIHVNE